MKFFFKKHVLYYSSQEIDSLKAVMGNESLHNLLQKNIASQDVFAKYKEDPLSQEWQPLLYRIAIKIPFIDIDIGTSDGLTSLFEKNEEKVQAASDKELVNFDHCVFDILNTITDDEVSPEKYFEALSPILEGKKDGD